MVFRRFFAALMTAILILGLSTGFAPEASAEDEMPYRITVDLTNQIVTIYSNEDGSIVRQMLCSAGVQDSTPMGTYKMPANEEGKDDRKDWYHFKGFGVYAAYASRIYRGIMFHSLTCKKKNVATVYKSAIEDFGRPASHGCIRLRFEDAYFICKNCLKGTEVTIYKEEELDEELRTLLFESSYTNEDGMSYATFLGIPDDGGEILSRSSTGEAVESLQMRLRALGFYAEEVNGVYDTATIAAVKQVQRAMGETANGYTTQTTLNEIYASDAPTAMKVTLSEGMSGPIVRNVQTWLTTLKLYEGEIDSIYDMDVIDAVKNFQTVYGYEADGVMVPEQQSALRSEARRIEAAFGDEDYELDSSSESIAMATISAKVRVRIREEANTESRALESLKNGTSVMVLGQEGEWVQVRYGSTTGYVREDLLVMEDRQLSCLTYTSASGKSEHIGNNASEYIEGAPLPAAVYAETYAAETEQITEEETSSKKKTTELSHGLLKDAVVNTGSNSVKLNMRENDSSDSKVLTELDNGTPLTVLLEDEEWSLVESGKLKGFVLNDYLTYVETATGIPAAEEDDEEVITPDDIDASDMFSATIYEKCPVYDLDSEDAHRVATLNKGIQVKVIMSDDEWTLVEYKGNRGYIQNQYLQFNMWDTYV